MRCIMAIWSRIYASMALCRPAAGFDGAAVSLGGSGTLTGFDGHYRLIKGITPRRLEHSRIAVLYLRGVGCVFERLDRMQLADKCGLGLRHYAP